MATLIGSETHFIDTLNHLIELDYDAAAAYHAAIERVEDPAIKDQLGQFMSDHQRHTQELGTVVRDLGQLPPSGTDLKAILTQGKVVIGGLMGDKGILRAMDSNEDDSNQAYEKALLRQDIAAGVETILQRNLADERRHRAWIENRLGMMG